MKNMENNRREFIKTASMGGLGAGLLGADSFGLSNVADQLPAGLLDEKSGMKITGIQTYFNANNHYVEVLTDAGITGLGEATLNTRQLAVDGVFKHLEPVLVGQDPMRIEHIWQSIFRGTFWRGGPVLLSALSGIDMALWDIKGKALNTPVYNLLGGKCRDKMRVYINVGGRTPDDLCRNAERVVAEGYTLVRICPHDNIDGFYEPGTQVRRSIPFMRELRKAIGDDIEIVFEVHTRLSPTRAIELCNAIAEYKPVFVEDPIRADSPESFRVLRSHTNVPIGTSEKLGAKWDYKTIIEEDLVDYLRTDVCNCGGITEMKKIAAYGEPHYMEMVPHGVPHVGYLAAMHVNFATPNFYCQENWISGQKPEHLKYDVIFENGFQYLGDAPGLGIELIKDKLNRPFVMREHPYWRREDGTVQDW